MCDIRTCHRVCFSAFIFWWLVIRERVCLLNKKFTIFLLKIDIIVKIQTSKVTCINLNACIHLSFCSILIQWTQKYSTYLHSMCSLQYILMMNDSNSWKGRKGHKVTILSFHAMQASTTTCNSLHYTITINSPRFHLLMLIWNAPRKYQHQTLAVFSTRVPNNTFARLFSVQMI